LRERSFFIWAAVGFLGMGVSWVACLSVGYAPATPGLTQRTAHLEAMLSVSTRRALQPGRGLAALQRGGSRMAVPAA
jgi:hypothetical protein